jgi:N-acetylated-alpha-linked acidic dipeptidase
MALRLANAEILPLNYAAYGEEIGEFMTDLAGKKAFSHTRRVLKAFTDRGRKLEKIVRSPDRIAAMTPEDRARLNRKIIAAERALRDERGLPDRPWFKHLIYACRYTYLPLTLPGLTEAYESGVQAAVEDRERILAGALARAAVALD